MRRFRQVLNRLGCDNFEVYEQVGANWSNTQTSGRFVQIMRFRDRKHQLAVQAAERSDPAAQELIAEFCDLVNYPYQQQQGQFAVGFYSSVLPVAPLRAPRRPGEAAPADQAAEPAPEAAFFGTPVSDTEPLAEPEPDDFAATPTNLAAADESATDESATDAELLTDDLTEAEQETAADAFAQHAEHQQGVAGEPAASTESTEPIATEETAPLDADEPEEDAPLPSLDAEDEPQPDVHRTEPTDVTPVFNDAAPAESTPQEPTPAEANGEFNLLDDLDAADDLEMTDDDLARLAQELSAEPPPRTATAAPTATRKTRAKPAFPSESNRLAGPLAGRVPRSKNPLPPPYKHADRFIMACRRPPPDDGPR
jgi:hypothetical protein